MISRDERKVVCSILAVIVAMFVGAGLHSILTSKDAPRETDTAIRTVPTPGTSEECEQDGIARLVINADYQNAAIIEFVFAEPIAPDFPVGYGPIGGGYDTFLDDSDKWDPLGIGVEDPMRLINRIRKRVRGVTKNIYAEGYALKLEIAESHLSRKKEIIAEVIALIRSMHEKSGYTPL